MTKIHHAAIKIDDGKGNIDIYDFNGENGGKVRKNAES